PPSDAITLGTLEGVGVAFLPRHGKGHRISPTEVPARANIWALKSLGVEQVIAISAVGSLKEEVCPLDLMVPDQLIDRTRSRINSFFEGGRPATGVVVHAPFADPFCPQLNRVVYRAAREVAPRVHRGGALVVIEGPQFSTRAESHLYRSWGASIIGMTALPEARLAREAEICYATLACVTDYDCWHESYESVTVDMIIANLNQNVEAAKGILRLVAARLPQRRRCGCGHALKTAIVTAPHVIPEKVKTEMSLLLGKYVPPSNPPARRPRR
ncbi:MAG: S-methyl-5'-thioadenosine phosphorylase, partial [Chloroflexota bacterium]